MPVAENPVPSEAPQAGMTPGGMAYYEWGPPQGWPVVLLHGLRAGGRWFDDLAQGRPDGARAIAVDLRGRGRSRRDPAGDYRLDCHVDDIEELVDDLDLGPTVMAGHSYGALVALYYARRHPDRLAGLVLMEAAARLEPEGLERIQREVAITPESFPTADEARELIGRIHPSTERRMAVRLATGLDEQPDGSLAWSIDPAVLRTGVPNEPVGRVLGALGRVTCPTAILRGTRSDLVSSSSVEEMREALRLPAEAIQVVEVAEAGHMLLDDEVTATTTAFWKALQQMEVHP